MDNKNCSKKRIINFRPCAFAALLMCSAIFVAVRVFDSLWYLLPMIAIATGIVVYYLCKKNFIRMISFLLVYIVGIGVALLAVTTYTNHNYNNQKAIISGRVSVVNSVWEDSAYVTIENVVINTNGKTHRLGGKTKVSMYNYQQDSLEVGDKVAFEGTIKCVDILANLSYVYKDNIKYTTSANFNKTEVVDGKLTLTESIMYKSKQNLYSTMGEDNGAVAYAILFGDKTLIDDSIKQSFRDSGTAHLLAVSGLHVGFLISLLYFVIDLLKINKYVKLSILAVVLLVYSYICGFAPSVVRASIMGIILILCKISGGRYDSLSSLGLSCIILLLFRPLYLFDVGFLMSYGAVLGIILLYKFLDKINIKNKIVRSIIASLWLTIVAQIGVMPIVAEYFGTVATYSVFANLLIVPIFGIGYILLCIFNLLVLIMPFLSFIMVVVKGIFSFIITVNNIMATLPGAVVNIFGFSLLGCLAFYVLLFTISRFVMLNTKFKSIICCLIATICVSILVVVNLPLNYKINQASFVNSGYTCLITTQDNKKVIVDLDVNNLDIAKDNLLKAKVNKLDCLVFTTSYNFSVSKMRDFVEYFGRPTFYVYKGHKATNNISSTGFSLVEYDTDKQVVISNIVVCGYEANGEFVATKLQVGGTEMLFVDSVDESLIQTLGEVVDSSVDILCTQDDNYIYAQIIDNKHYVTRSSEVKFALDQI